MLFVLCHSLFPLLHRGEEFAVLLPGTNLVAARLFAEGTRNAFGGLMVEGLPATKRFTASFGVAERAKGETISDLMGRADKALYLAKNSGRDCVKIAPRPSGRRGDDWLRRTIGQSAVNPIAMSSSSIRDALRTTCKSGMPRTGMRITVEIAAPKR